MPSIFKLAAVSAAMIAAAASFSVQAQSVDVKVTGQIVPAACAIDIGGGGVFDYGNIPASTLADTAYTRLESKTASFSITCGAPVKIAFRVRDNRSASRIPGILDHPSFWGFNYGENQNFGLGTVSGVNVGGYGMLIPENILRVDGLRRELWISHDGGNSWGDGGFGIVSHDNRLQTWVLPGGSPVAAEQIVGELQVQAVLNKGSELPLTGPVPLDGLATFEVVYL